ncbi:cell division protein FtsL [Kitasatospora sp. MMS16-BH015]|uniref:FtsB family cell division protein n=1 Tax=Kitasatospora sp. MMS16-BH015 TaxID=2018025 RepID=UPI000CA308F6|nr:septum formation initiator family protein [Kitasatospora sp. MMS16-BH015]AUG76735.1 cell division protein FtsL [Kitasatospora sp. MMS16-BH015]
MPVVGGRTRERGALPGQGGRARLNVRIGVRPARGRVPFVVLVVALLSGGLLGLLALNTALNEGTFELSRLQKQTTELTDQQQTLQKQIDQGSAPDALERRARELGMVPGGDPAFLGEDGKVLGKPGQAKDDPAVPRSGNELWGKPTAAPSAPAAPSAAPSTAPSPTASDGTGVQINTAPPATTGGTAR